MKKAGLVFIICCILGFGGCSSKDVDQGDEKLNVVDEKIEASDSVMDSMITTTPLEEDVDVVPEGKAIVDGLLFTTEYKIEDYCQGCFIVSKNDGLLYGVLDREGNEIIPVQYDEIEFQNKDAVMKGKCDEIYILTSYENDKKIVDKTGTVLMDTGGCLRYIEYEYDNGDGECARFYLYKEDTVCFYNNDLEFLFEIPQAKDETAQYKWLNSEYFLISRVATSFDNGEWEIRSSVELYDVPNNTIKVLAEGGSATEYVIVNKDYIDFVVLVDGQGLDVNTFVYHQYKSDESGIPKLDTILTYEEFAPLLEEYRARKSIKLLDIILGDKKIYESNGTWKFEYRGSGEAVYDIRYYDCIENDDWYFLLNEDNQLCLINSEGNLMVDYGWLTYKNGEIYFNGGILDFYDNYFPGDDGVCFTQGNNVYFFYNKEW